MEGCVSDPRRGDDSLVISTARRIHAGDIPPTQRRLFGVTAITNKPVLRLMQRVKIQTSTRHDAMGA
jgi:hypothetical protein